MSRPAAGVDSGRTRLEPILFVPDCHIPYHDTRAFKLMVRVARAIKPTRLVVLGDFADFWCISAHDKSPERKLTLKDEVDAVNTCLDELDRLAPQRFYVEGNHEYRLDRYLMTRAPELFGLVTTRELFKLKQRGWSYTPYMQHLRIGKLHVTHECGNAGAQAHNKARATFEGNVAIGHTHRLAIHYQGNAKGTPHVGAMFGWLGDVDAVDYTHKVKAREWQLGFGVGWYDVRTLNVHLQAIPIINYECIVNGERYAERAT